MAKFYPPYVEGKLPAQAGIKLTIPYQLNRAQGIKDLEGKKVFLKIKGVSTNKEITTLNCDFDSYNENGTFFASFDISENLLEIGQYYKAQLCFDDNGYYSTIGVFKYTAIPTLIVENLKDNQTNLNIYNYIGSYTNADLTEKVYSYRFDLYQNGILVESSGDLIHNIEIDGKDTYTLKQGLQEGSYYNLQYSVKTINGLKASSKIYVIYESRNPLATNLPEGSKLIAENNYDDGFVAIRLEFPQDKNNIRGKYRLSKKIRDRWHEIGHFILNFSDLPQDYEIYKDFTCEQGKTYKYSIQQVSGTLMSGRLESNEVYSDFEDLFLGDGVRQLKVRFNPKVSSFKNTILENKMDTIGSKYPFVFRNGNTKYKELPISGLISYLMDDNRYFILDEDVREPVSADLREQTAAGETGYLSPTDLISENIYAERIFKLTVLDWLTNGQPKIFRSPTEGNYIVRLMNTSLAPNDTLGRMLHTFNATGYEVAEFNFDNLITKDLIKNLEDKTENQVEVEVWNLNDSEKEKDFSSNPIIGARFMYASGVFKLTYASGYTSELTIGNTGYYEINIPKDDPIIKINTISDKASGVLEFYSKKQFAEVPLVYDGEEIETLNYGEEIVELVGEEEGFTSWPTDSKKIIDTISYVRFFTNNYTNGFYQYEIGNTTYELGSLIEYRNLQETKVAVGKDVHALICYHYFIINQENVENDLQ